MPKQRERCLLYNIFQVFNFNIRKILCEGLIFPIFDSCNRWLFSLFETIWSITEFNKYKTINFFL
jgi:hypothetical protein